MQRGVIGASGWLMVGVLGLLLALPGWAAGNIPGPLGQDSGRIKARGILELSFLPKDAEAQVAKFGGTVPIELMAATQPSQVSGHPFELFVAVAPIAVGSEPDVPEGTELIFDKTANRWKDKATGEIVETPPMKASADYSTPLVRCGTVTAAGAAPVPGTAITASHTATGKNSQTGRTTYSVAATKKVSVGVIDFPLLAQVAGLSDTVTKSIPASSFSVSMERNQSLRFYAEVPWSDAKLGAGTLAFLITAPSWEYVPAPGK